MEKQQFEIRSMMNRRMFAAMAGTLVVGGVLGAKVFGESEPGQTNSNNLSTDNQLALNSDTAGENSQNSQDRSLDTKLIRIQDLPRDTSLYANTISPEEIIDTLTHGNDQDIREIFEVPSENYIINDNQFKPQIIRTVFDKLATGLRVGFDANSIEKYLNELDGKDKFINEATIYDNKIAQIIGGYSDEDLDSGLVEKMNLTKYFKYAHNHALSRFYDSATAFPPERRSLNENININTYQVKQYSYKNGKYGLMADIEVTNIMDIKNPPISAISNTRGNMIVWATKTEDGIKYDLSPENRTSLSPLEKIQ